MVTVKKLKEEREEEEKTVKEKLSDMISLANSHCSKIHSNIKTTHNTEKNTKFCFATTRKSNKKHTRF